MAYIPFEHYINCAGCVKKIFRSDAVRGSYNKLLYCKKCVDYKWPKVRQLPRDPRQLPSSQINIEGIETSVAANARNWEDIEWEWQSIMTNWEDL